MPVRIKTTKTAIKVMANGPDDAGYERAVKYLWSAINYYCETDTENDGMTLDEWIREGDWHFPPGARTPTAKSLAFDYDNR